MTQNIIIVGAGAGMSAGVAEKFGIEGYTVGLISRSAAKLAQQVENLQQKNIKAYYATADAYNNQELESAVRDLLGKMGGIDTLVYNAAAMKMKNLLSETAEELAEDFKISVANAFHLVKAFLPELKASQGSVLFTGGGFALQPSPQFGSLSLGKAGIRSLAFQLNEALKPENVFVGTITIQGYIQPDSATHSPKILAEKYWELNQSRDRAEIQY
jgi:short-subunit dehydrogenase